MAVEWHTPHQTVGKPLLRPWMAVPPISGLVARPALFERLLTAIGEGPAVLRGPAGYGKTTLATWLCHQPETSERFPGGLLWVTLGEHVTGPELAGRVNDLVEQLTGSRPTFTDPGQAGAELGKLLDSSPEPILLIIDDAETTAQLDPFRGGGGGSRQLITTRSHADGIDVDRMTEPEAKALLLRDLPTDVTPAVVDEILARTGRWPLPLGVANRTARRAVRHGAEPSSALRRVVEQHGANPVEATVQAGLDLLPSAYADRFAELAIFGQDAEIPLEVLHLLWGGRFGEAARISEALADLSLVYRGKPGTIRLHDVIRDHLIRTTDAGQRVALHRRLLEAGDRWHTDYLIAHLAEHLRAADRPGELEQTLTDLSRTMVRLQRHGPAAVAADLAYAKSPAARDLERVIRQDSRLLGPTDPPDALAAVLASRLDGEGLAETTDALTNRQKALVNRSATIPPAASVAIGANRLVTSPGQVWDLPSLRPIRTLGCMIEGPLVVARDDTWIAYATRHRITVWDVACDQQSKAFPADETTAMTLAPDGDSLVVCDANGHVWMVSAATGECRQDFPAHQGEIRAAAVAPDGSWMVTGSADGTAAIWDWETSKLLRRVSGSSGITAVTPDSRWLAIGNDDGTAQIWDPESGRLLHRLRCEGPVRTMAAGRWLATGTTTGTIKVWDARTGRPLTMMRVDSPVHDCRWFDDDRGLLVFGTGSTQAFTLN